MKTRNRILLFSLLVLILGVFAWLVLLHGQPEPVYKEKRVSFWINNLGRGDVKSIGRAMDTLTRQGSNSVPYLIKALEMQESRVHKTYRALWRNLPPWTKNLVPRPVDAEDVRVNAAITFGLIGEDARAAIPALVQSMQRDDNKNVRAWAATSFAGIGRTNQTVTLALVAALK